MSRKIIRVGFDFDGVVAYNPLRIFRTLISSTKRNIMGIRKLNFIYPQGPLQRFVWTLLHESSVFPAKGVDLLKESVSNGLIEAHIVTGRYSFLDNQLYTWLNRYKLKQYFRTVNLNLKDEQPHLFKERIIDKYRLEYFIEDNLDIVEYLDSRGKRKGESGKGKILWIYNLLDRNHPYRYKYPYLEKALEAIVMNNEV